MGTLFAQYLAGYVGRGVEHRGRDIGERRLWKLREVQDLLDEWIVTVWPNRPHDGLRDPLAPGQAFTPNEKYATLLEAAGYTPVALTADDYVELLPAKWQAITASGVRISRRWQRTDAERWVTAAARRPSPWVGRRFERSAEDEMAMAAGWPPFVAAGRCRFRGDR